MNGRCVYQNSAHMSPAAGCSRSIYTQQTWCCSKYHWGRPFQYAYSKKTRQWSDAKSKCDYGSYEICQMRDLVDPEDGYSFDTGSGAAWTMHACSDDVYCYKLLQQEVEEASKREAEKRAGGVSMYPNNTIDVTGNDMLITFLFAMLILLCVANVCVFVRRKLRLRQQYAALDKVADSDTDAEAVLINN